MTDWTPIEFTASEGRKVRGELTYRLPFTGALQSRFDDPVDCIDRLAINVSSDVIGDHSFVCREVAYGYSGAVLICKSGDVPAEAITFSVHERLDRGG